MANAKIERTQKLFLKAMKAQFTEEHNPFEKQGHDPDILEGLTRPIIPPEPVVQECPMCGGRGYRKKSFCHTCGGTGQRKVRL